MRSMEKVAILGAGLLLLVSGCVRFGICDKNGDCGKGEVCGDHNFCVPGPDAGVGADGGDDGGAGRCPASPSTLREQVPVISAIDPQVWCQGGDTAVIRVTGDYLNESDGVPAELSLQGSAWPLGFGVSSAVESEGGVLRHDAAELRLDVAVLDALSPVVDDATVTNKDGRGALCASAPVPVVISPRPVVDTPARQRCLPDYPAGGPPITVSVTGSDLQLDPGQAPGTSLEFASGGAGVLSLPLQPGAACSATPAGWSHSCTSLEAQLGPTQLAPGTYDLTLTQPASAGCPASLPAGSLQLVGAAPAVTTLPSLFCVDTPLIIDGSGFRPGLEAFLAASSTDPSRLSLIVENLSENQVVLRIPPGSTIPTGAHLYMGSGTACLADAGAINAGAENPGFFVDPWIIPADTNLTLKAHYAAGTAEQLLIQNANTTIGSTPLFTEAGYAEVQMEISGGNPGVYGAEVTVTGLCSARFEVPVTVVDSPTLAIDASSVPSRLSNQVTRRFTFRMIDPLSDAPWVYLESSTDAYLLEGAVWRPDANGGLVEVTLPGPARGTGIPAVPQDSYKLCVIDPAGAYGCTSPGLLRIVSAAPPVIRAVRPTSPVATPAYPAIVTILGSGLVTGTGAGVRIECASGSDVPTSIMGLAGSTQLRASFELPPTGLKCQDQRSTLVVTTSGGEATFGPLLPRAASRTTLDATALSQGIPPALPGRERAAAALLRHDGSRRFLFFAGGKDSAGALLSDVAGVEVGLDGSLLGTFEAGPSLPGGLARMGVAVSDRYLYLLGGEQAISAGGDASSDLLQRAKLLDPADAPRLTGYRVQKAKAGANGVPRETQLYALTAYFSAQDLDNPSGESLPSTPLTVHLPPALTLAVKVQPVFDSVRDPGDRVLSVGQYQLYRTPAASPDAWQRITRAALPIDAGETPIPTPPPRVGTLGAWVSVANLRAAVVGRVARVDPAVVATDAPACPNNSCVALHLFGGRRWNGTALASTSDIYTVRIVLGNNRRHLGPFDAANPALAVSSLRNASWNMINGPFIPSTTGMQATVVQGPWKDQGLLLSTGLIYVSASQSDLSGNYGWAFVAVDTGLLEQFHEVSPLNGATSPRAFGARWVSGRRMVALGGRDTQGLVPPETAPMPVIASASPAALGATTGLVIPLLERERFGFASDGTDAYLVGGAGVDASGVWQGSDVIHVVY